MKSVCSSLWHGNSQPYCPQMGLEKPAIPLWLAVIRTRLVNVHMVKSKCCSTGPYFLHSLDLNRRLPNHTHRFHSLAVFHIYCISDTSTSVLAPQERPEGGFAAASLGLLLTPHFSFFFFCPPLPSSPPSCLIPRHYLCSFCVSLSLLLCRLPLPHHTASRIPSAVRAEVH